jgi:hypothetical protein
MAAQPHQIVPQRSISRLRRARTLYAGMSFGTWAPAQPGGERHTCAAKRGGQPQRVEAEMWCKAPGGTVTGRLSILGSVWSSKAGSVGQGAQCGFQLGVDRTAFAQDPRQPEQSQEDAGARSWLVQGKRGQVGGLPGCAAQRPA